MNTKIKELAENSKEKFTVLESRLSGVLKPIKPRKEFVHDIAYRMKTGSQGTFIDRIINLQFVTLILAGMISLAVFLAVIGKVLFSLLVKRRTA
jgi:hypothetical protein